MWMEAYTPHRGVLQVGDPHELEEPHGGPADVAPDGDGQHEQPKPKQGAAPEGGRFVKAVIAGFDVKDAMALLRMDDVYIEGFEVKDVRANLQGDNLSRCIGRISGSHGKTKYTIENVTRTRIVLADTKIWVMGTTQNIRVARDAICDLIRGSPAAKVCTRIRSVMNRVNDTY
ncbi:RNA-binding protein PNO1 [Strigomonas culicis]|uniref:RNA-binding protein PNO1 n=1 Tax=Strigomonas culicis TaxID=28005 RepID=S9V091_9TRYP|nr:RNA-binding protein PNO1 [Strigomonas culicis]|eukprot:EPY20316.1 RNA-binding protein PNO1 [Strigomonas culicis]